MSSFWSRTWHCRRLPVPWKWTLLFPGVRSFYGWKNLFGSVMEDDGFHALVLGQCIWCWILFFLKISLEYFSNFCIICPTIFSFFGKLLRSSPVMKRTLANLPGGPASMSPLRRTFGSALLCRISAKKSVSKAASASTSGLNGAWPKPATEHEEHSRHSTCIFLGGWGSGWFRWVSFGVSASCRFLGVYL